MWQFLTPVQTFLKQVILNKVFKCCSSYLKEKTEYALPCGIMVNALLHARTWFPTMQDEITGHEPSTVYHFEAPIIWYLDVKIGVLCNREKGTE